MSKVVIQLNKTSNYSDYIIIDIRSHEDYVQGHIPESIHVPHFELLANPNQYLNTTENYLIICDEGKTSKTIVSLLKEYNLTNYEGGMLMWMGELTTQDKP